MELLSARPGVDMVFLVDMILQPLVGLCVDLASCP